MLTILNDPVGITGRSVHALDLGATLQTNIERHLAGGGGCRLRINGDEVNPLTDPRLDARPSALDVVTVIRTPATGIEIAYVVAAILVVGSYLMMPKPASDPVVQESPNNRLTGQSNIARTYQGIPDVYGLRRVWPDLIQPSAVEYIDNIKHVTEWLCVSRGRGSMSDIQFADTPLLDISGATVESFQPALTPFDYPELNDTTLVDVYETFPSEEVNGQEMGSVTFPSVFSRMGLIGVNGSSKLTLTFTDEAAFDDIKLLPPAGLADISFAFAVYLEGASIQSVGGAFTVLSYTVTGPDVEFEFDVDGALVVEGVGQTVLVNIAGGDLSTAIGPFTLPTTLDRIRWNVAFLRGLQGTVEIDAEWWQIDDDGVEVPSTRESESFEYTDATYDQRFYTEQVTPTAGLGRYRITFARTTADLTNGADVAKLEELYAVRYYAEKVLPGVTVLKVTTTATAEATGFRDRKFNLRWNRLVRTLAAPTLSASRNFARAMAHLWCVAGEDILQLDTEKLQEINDLLGEDSTLLRFDGTLDDADMSLGERLQRIAFTARCAVWRDGTRWTVTRDQLRGSHDLQLDYRNLAASGDSLITYAAHLPASFDGVEIEYTDETTQATKAYSRLSIADGVVAAGTPLNPKKIKMPGCATEEQADNRAHLEARRLLYQRVNVQDTTLSDGGQIGLGTLVKWIDPNDFAGDDGLQGGEVMTIDGTLITTSEPLNWRGESTGRMMFTGIDGAPLGAPVIVTPAADGVTLASVPSGLFVADDDRQCGSRYAFGPGLSEAETEAAGLYEATRVTPAGDGTFTVALSNYDERFYEADPA